MRPFIGELVSAASVGAVVAALALEIPSSA